MLGRTEVTKPMDVAGYSSGHHVAELCQPAQTPDQMVSFLGPTADNQLPKQIANDASKRLPHHMQRSLPADHTMAEGTPPPTTTGLSPGQSIGDRKKGSHVKPYTLPPCKVCGSKGTGLHYGVNTCEACKGFFRRCLVKNSNFTCRKSEQCKLRPGQKLMCSFCRLQKCISVGMSVEAIKTGRYTLEKRRSDTLEVKRLLNPSALLAVEEKSEERVTYLEETIGTIVAEYNRVNGDLVEFDREAQSRLREYTSRLQQQESQFGKQRAKSYQEFQVIMEKTGQQVDDRLDMLTSWLAPVTRTIKRMVRFVKTIPGFKELPMCDQLILLKTSLIETWLVSRHNAFCLEYKCFINIAGRTFDLDKLLGEDFATDMVIALRRVKSLHLTAEEQVILTGFVIVTPDRAGLSNPDQVSRVQDLLLEMLLWQLRTNHPGDRLLFPRVISAVTAMRNLQQHPEKEVLGWLVRLVDDGRLKVPPVFWEIITPMMEDRKPHVNSVTHANSDYNANLIENGEEDAAKQQQHHHHQQWMQEGQEQLQEQVQEQVQEQHMQEQQQVDDSAEPVLTRL